jgi:hypothetical protein
MLKRVTVIWKVILTAETSQHAGAVDCPLGPKWLQVLMNCHVCNSSFSDQF